MSSFEEFQKLSGRNANLLKNITGLKFGRLVARYPVVRKNRRVYWNCLCECGKEVNVTTGHLTHGDTQSCGCFKREQQTKATQEKLFKGVGDLSGTYIS